MDLLGKKYDAFINPDLPGVKLTAAHQVEHGLVATIESTFSRAAPRLISMFIPYGTYVGTAIDLHVEAHADLGRRMSPLHFMGKTQQAFHNALASEDLAHYRRMVCDVKDFNGTQPRPLMVNSLPTRTGFIGIRHDSSFAGYEVIGCISPEHSSSSSWAISVVEDDAMGDTPNAAPTEPDSYLQAHEAMYRAAARRCIDDSPDFMHTASWNFGPSVMTWALRKKSSALAKCLIEKSPSIDRIDLFSGSASTALTRACMFNCTRDTVAAMLLQGASIFGPNSSLPRPIWLAISRFTANCRHVHLIKATRVPEGLVATIGVSTNESPDLLELTLQLIVNHAPLDASVSRFLRVCIPMGNMIRSQTLPKFLAATLASAAP